ncbi:MAG: cupin domain-containing protein [Candidatus Thorarchaeota archaeon]|nr:MAG: cupin domain-containing protein [Candidatus Thorarchaeota archaeon]
MYVINYKQREAIDIEMAGSRGAKMRWLVGVRTGASTFAMRHFEIAPGGKVPLHTHAEEHEVFVLGGKARLLGSAEDQFAQKDDVIFIPSEAPHGYDNSKSTEPFTFICVIPILNRE